ncbi:hypothetical protein V2A60_004423 [Cordyceps javanica]
MFSKSLTVESRGVRLGLLAALGACLALNLSALVFSLRILMRGTRRYSYLAGDHPRELPLRVRTIQVDFHDDPVHYKLKGANATAEWNALRPPGTGFVFLGEDPQAFDVSMWHQLHCLNHIRAMLVNGDDGSDHTEHCFHYLRQGILCAADTTLEWGATTKLANGDTVASGVGTTHTCRDWHQVYDWMENNHERWTPEMSKMIKEAVG